MTWIREYFERNILKWVKFHLFIFFCKFLNLQNKNICNLPSYLEKNERDDFTDLLHLCMMS